MSCMPRKPVVRWKHLVAKSKATATKEVDKQQNTEIKKLKKQVKSLQGEKLCKHITQGLISFDQASPKIYTLNGLLKGDDIDKRSGNMVKAKRLEISGQIFANSPTLLFDTLIRIMVVKESSALGSSVSLAQLFGTSTPLTYAIRNMQTRDQERYTILKDIVCGIGPVSTSVNGAGVSTVALQGYPSIKDFYFDIPLNVNVNHARGNAGTEADIETNAYFLVFITDVSTVNAVAHRFDCNYEFYDI